MATQEDTIVVTGLGMVSSLGLDAVMACAAARAGLRRAQELSVQVLNQETNDMEPVVGHAIAHMTDGFEGKGRLFRILQLALADVQRSLGVRWSETVASCGWLLALPDASGWSVNGQALAGQPGASAGASWSPQPFRQVMEQHAGIPIAAQQMGLVSEGHAGFVIAVGQAVQQLRARHRQRCIVGALDSLIDPAILQRLYEQGRLKTPDNPAGLIPGEAGAFLVLETLDAARRRQMPVLGTIVEAVAEFEPDAFLTDKPGLGVAMARMVGRLSQLRSLQTSPWLLSDHNGEVYRASELGYTLNRLVGPFPLFQEAEMDFPAVSFGDTGAASGAISLCTALRAFARDYAPARQAVILSSADAGRRAALLIQAPNR